MEQPKQPHTPETIFPLLREAILKAREAGLTICYRKFGDAKTCACAIVAYLWQHKIEADPEHPHESPIVTFSRATGISIPETWAIVTGFDGKADSHPRSPGPWLDIGIMLARV